MISFLLCALHYPAILLLFLCFDGAGALVSLCSILWLTPVPLDLILIMCISLLYFPKAISPPLPMRALIFTEERKQ